jgi:renalase
MKTRPDGDWQFDHGAQYFTAHDPAFREDLARWLQAGAPLRARQHTAPNTGERA